MDQNQKLIMSIITKNMAWTRRLLAEGADPNYLPPFSESRRPLHIAIDLDNTELVQMLLDARADPLKCERVRQRNALAYIQDRRYPVDRELHWLVYRATLLALKALAEEDYVI